MTIETVRAAITAQLPTGQPFGVGGVRLVRGEWATWVNRGDDGQAVPERPGLLLNPGDVYVECANQPAGLLRLSDVAGEDRELAPDNTGETTKKAKRRGSWVGPSVETYLVALCHARGIDPDTLRRSPEEAAERWRGVFDPERTIVVVTDGEVAP